MRSLQSEKGGCHPRVEIDPRPFATAPCSVATVLAIDGLAKRFGPAVALDGVSFTVAPGEVFGFVGGNGAGKTTTMRIVLGVLDADAGAVTWKGGPLGPAQRRRIGYLPE